MNTSLHKKKNIAYKTSQISVWAERGGGVCKFSFTYVEDSEI